MFIEFIKRVGENACRACYLIFTTKYNDTGAQMLDSIYHMTLKLV